MEQSDVSELQNFHYNFKNFEFDIDFDNELKYANDIPYLEYFPVFVQKDYVYYEVAVITNLENQQTDIHKVYVNKENGIIQFEDKFHQIWCREPHDGKKFEHHFLQNH